MQQQVCAASGGLPNGQKQGLSSCPTIAAYVYELRLHDTGEHSFHFRETLGLVKVCIQLFLAQR